MKYILTYATHYGYEIFKAEPDQFGRFVCVFGDKGGVGEYAGESYIKPRAENESDDIEELYGIICMQKL